MKLYCDKIDYISDKADTIKQVINSYKSIKYYNQYEELDAKLSKTILSLSNNSTNKNASNRNSVEKEKDKDSESKDKDFNINEILRNFNSSKDNFENLLKDLKTSITEIAPLVLQNNDISNIGSNVNTNYTNAPYNNSLTAITTTQNQGFLSNNNIYNNSNINNVNESSFKLVLLQLSKENTSLKLELKLLYDTLKQNNLIHETNKEEIDKYVKKNSYSYSNIASNTQSPDLGYKQKAVFNENNSSRLINSNYCNNSYKDGGSFIKIGDESLKDVWFLDVKRFIFNLKQNEFFF